ncbi:hypothetical protein NLJ89_g346 [Agrocybe chaxingu]|uniref:Uncharacterized protein n=1 Tax=Agrocybe chaxingu TaxID=84603 RepID=A0A9W8N1Y6_9AGAR|nr:hypothetical protein NLJ89_g346 [Agrocybe chaxingu]
MVSMQQLPMIPTSRTLWSITDDTVVKDIIHLRPLTGASDFINQAFSNQVATLEEILLTIMHFATALALYPIVTEFLASSEPSTNDHSFIKITMPAKYRIPPGTKTGKTEPKQRKNLLPVKQEGSDGRDTFSPTPAQTLPQVKRNAFYPLDLLPDHHGNYFQQTHAKLVQHDVFDADENLIPPWLFYDKLRPGTVVVVEATLICWHINSTGKEGDKDKNIYQIQGHRIRVLSDSDEDIEIRPILQLTTPISTMPTTTSPRKEASTAFSSFESPTKRVRRH